jgi:tRNA A37 threonylcarbamoyltransferase TsaD
MDWWEEEEGIENTLLKKKIQYRIQWEMKKVNTQFLTLKTNVTKEPSDMHKKTLKEEILDEITKKLMEKILAMVNQKLQEALKKFQDNKNKEHEKTQKQIDELREDFNKHQSETKDTIKKRYIN